MEKLFPSEFPVFDGRKSTLKTKPYDESVTYESPKYPSGVFQQKLTARLSFRDDVVGLRSLEFSTLFI